MVWLNWVRKLIFVCSMKLLTVVIVLHVLYWNFNDQIDMVLLDSSNKVFLCFLGFVLSLISKVARMFVQIRQEWRLKYGVIFAKLTSNDCFKQTLQEWRWKCEVIFAKLTSRECCDTHCRNGDESVVNNP